jgi:hypothetical protein
MDTKALIAEAKARFNHNSAKAQLKDKYDSKLIVADQGGLWRADQKTISFLHSMKSDWDNKLILVDTFDNPVLVNRVELLTKLKDTYNAVMREWYSEWVTLEKQR